MSSKPLISVVMPSYNHEKYISSALESVLSQTYANIEVLISDDASTDKTYEIAKKYLGDGRIVELTRQKRNIGPVNNLNYLISKTRGAYVCLLNTDDIFYPTKIEKQVAFLDENTDFGATFSFAQAINDDGYDVYPNNPHFEPRNIDTTKDGLLRKLFMEGNVLIHPSIMIRRSVYTKIGLYDNRFYQIPDLLKWIDLVDQFKIHIYPEKLIRFRFRANDLNASSGRRQDVINRTLFEYSYFVEKFIELAEKNPSFSEIFPEINRYSLDIPQDYRFAMYICENRHFSEMQSLGNVYRLIAKRKIYDSTSKIRELMPNRGGDYLYALGGKHMIFNVTSSSNIVDIYRKLSQELDQITSSVSWKLLTIIRVKLLDKIIPRRKKLIVKTVQVAKKAIALSKKLIAINKQNVMPYNETVIPSNQLLLTIVGEDVVEKNDLEPSMPKYFSFKIIPTNQLGANSVNSKYMCMSNIQNVPITAIEKMLFICENYKYDCAIAIQGNSIDLHHEGTVWEIQSNKNKFNCVIVCRRLEIDEDFINLVLKHEPFWLNRIISYALKRNMCIKAIKYVDNI